MMMQAPATEVMHLTNDEVSTRRFCRFADGRTDKRCSGYAYGLAVHEEHCVASTENSVLEIRLPITSGHFH